MEIAIKVKMISIKFIYFHFDKEFVTAKTSAKNKQKYMHIF